MRLNFLVAADCEAYQLEDQSPKITFMNSLRSDRQIPIILLAVIFSFVACLRAQETNTSEMKRGAIVVAAIQGNSKIFKPGATEGKNVTKGMLVQQGEKILTGKAATVSLAFENGSVIQVEPDSSFVVEEFLQAPWDASAMNLSEMKTEPSNSKLATFLEYGEVTSGVKKLNKGSSLNVTTPLGTAGIRGTDFQVGLQRDSSGASKSLSVTVASGEVAVSTSSGGTTSVTGGSSATVTVTPGANDTPSVVSQPTSSQISPESTLMILQSVRSQQESAASALTPAVLQGGSASSTNLSQAQKASIEDAAQIDAENVVDIVRQLASEQPSSAPDIAAYAVELAPNAAAEIAGAAASGAPDFAPAIAASVASMAPPMAAQIAASVALAVPSSAPEIAASVASAVPSQAPQIASTVAASVPSAAAAIAQSVAQTQPQQAEQIAAQTSAAVPDSADDIATQVQAQGEGGTATNTDKIGISDLPPVIPTNPPQPPPPAPTPTPPTPTPPTPTPPTPTATPPTPTPTPTPNPSNA